MVLEGGDGKILLPPPTSSAAASPLLFESSAPFACISSQREVHHSLMLKQAEWNQEVVPFDALDLVKSNKYQCPVCAMEFIDKNRFRHHYMVHSGERPYACPMCPYRARQNGTLKQHIVVKHGLKGWLLTKSLCSNAAPRRNVPSSEPLISSIKNSIQTKIFYIVLPCMNVRTTLIGLWSTYFLNI